VADLTLDKVMLQPVRIAQGHVRYDVGLSPRTRVTLGAFVAGATPPVEAWVATR
jgi:hypothetical protein